MMIRNVYIHDSDADDYVRLIGQSRPDLTIHVIERDARPLVFAEASALITFAPPAWIKDSKTLIWIHSTGAGIDAILPLLPPSVKLVTRSVGTLGARMGEYCLTYILFVFQNVAVRLRNQDRRVWDRPPAKPSSIVGKTALIAGTGAMGAAIAGVLRNAGMRTVGCSLHGAQREGFDEVSRLADIGSYEGTIDVIISVLPITEKTKDIQDLAFFRRFPDAVFINVGRGQTVRMPDLMVALDKGYLRCAVLDVFPTEPVEKGSPLWRQKNLIITPHVSGGTIPKEAATAFLDYLSKWERNLPIEDAVDVARGY